MEVTERSWARVQTTPETRLLLLDLRRDGCTLLGAPTDVVNARNHVAGRAFGRIVHAEHESVDGKLEARESGSLPDHPELPDVLAKYRVDLIVEQ